MLQMEMLGLPRGSVIIAAWAMLLICNCVQLFACILGSKKRSMCVQQSQSCMGSEDEAREDQHPEDLPDQDRC